MNNSDNVKKYIVNLINEEVDNLLKNKNITIDAPSYKKAKDSSIKIFLAGTIDCDQGSVDWQHKICDKIQNINDNKYSITIYNPRREEFPDNGSKEVRRQIRWEHAHMDDADYIIMNILEDSKSPITLMELGMYAESKKLIVFCKPKFYRYDNVKLVCQKYKIPLYNTNNINDICKIILNLKKKNNGIK